MAEEKKYEVLTPNPGFTGERNGVYFKDGKGMADEVKAIQLVNLWGYACPELFPEEEGTSETLAPSEQDEGVDTSETLAPEDDATLAPAEDEEDQGTSETLAPSEQDEGVDTSETLAPEDDATLAPAETMTRFEPSSSIKKWQSAKQAVEEYDFQTVEELDEFVAGDTRKSVQEAAEKRREALKETIP